MTTYTLTCDHPLCPATVVAQADGDGPSKAARNEMLRTAERDGWTCDGDKHWCREHRGERV